MNTPDPIRELFAGLVRPQPPDELAGPALAAASRALAEPPANDIWDRIWFSRPLRLAWAATLILLLAGHLMVSLTGVAGPDPSPAPIAALGGIEPELAQVASVPTINLSATSWGPSPDGPTDATWQPRKERHP